ncbi:MAG: hypothetical protein ACYC99_11015 [Candidatus Geothermincolia bacterium]
MDAEEIDKYLSALSEQLGLQGEREVALVVCGGAAQDVSEPFRELLAAILEELGYGDIGRRLP